MKKIKIGYLPFFLEMYDAEDQHYRDPLVDYMNTLIRKIESCGIEVVLPDDICRVKNEFSKAAELFNSEGVDAVVTQHLAYSPSLESIDALSSLKAPIVVFDTTPDYGILREADSRVLMRANHGIHGVQDMCSMLTRRGIRYWLCVGHAEQKTTWEDLVSACRAAAMSMAFKRARIGSVAGSFEGMGDFSVSDERISSTLGARIVRMDAETASAIAGEVSESEIDEELLYERQYFNVVAANENAMRNQARWGLALRKWVDREHLSAVSVNFQSLTDGGFKAMPFVECSRMLSRGIGYAGEGDILTAGLIGAIDSVYSDTTFAEMFCPDWEKDLVFISHMGEMNPALAQWKPSIVDCPMSGKSGNDTVYVIGCAKPGKAVYVNLAPLREGFRLILSDIVLTGDGKQGNAYDNYRNQGWFRPAKPVSDFLREFSMLGGTHHSAVVYGGDISTLKLFGEMMNFDVKII
ncbi:MAG: hypothetical protein J5563_04320 [Clostridia bacterium]|nr:hypothetical protein [Clostridia bacterium]